MLALIYDTETNKLPVWSAPDSNPEQPHIVQIAAALYDTDTRKPVASVNLISIPNGWDIQEATIDVHGISPEKAMLVGVPEETLLVPFFALWRQADIRVGHNEAFDARIIRIALHRYADQAHLDEWNAGQAYCTMAASRPLVRALDKRGRAKTPNLSEAFEFFTGRPLANAHTAHGDTRGCAAVYFALQGYLGTNVGNEQLEA